MATLLLDMVVLDTTARDLLMLNLKPGLMLLFFMEDMAMVVLAMLDLATLLLDMVVLDTTARDLLMLNLRQRLMLLSFTEDMDMVDLDMPDSGMLVLDMDMLPLLLMATPLLGIEVLAIMARGLLKKHLSIFMKQKLKAISDWHFVIQCPLLRCRN